MLNKFSTILVHNVLAHFGTLKDWNVLLQIFSIFKSMQLLTILYDKYFFGGGGGGVLFFFVFLFIIFLKNFCY